MFGLLKKIFKKDADPLSAPSSMPQTAPAFARTATPSQPGRSSSNPFSGKAAGGATTSPSSPSPLPAPTLNPTAAVRPPAAPADGELPDAIALPLETVLAGLSPEFQNLFSSDLDPGLEVQFPLQAILPQLSSGRVRVAFGELRNSCPNGSCRAGADLDGKLIELPLASVLSRINPALLPRRTQRQLMDVPKDVTGLFGSIGEPITASAPTLGSKPAAAPVPLARSKTAAPRRKAVPDDLESIPSPFGPPASNPAETSAPATPAAKRRSAVPDDLETIPSPFSFPGSAPQPPASTSPAPAARSPEPEPEAEEPPKIKFNPTPLEMPATAAPAVAKASGQPVPAPASRQTAAKLQAVKDDNYLGFSLGEVMDGWDEAVMAEVQQENLAGAQLDLPVGEVDLAMRKGRIVFTWKTLRSWMAPAPGGDSPNDSVELTLPLKVVAPKFLALRKPKGRQRKAHVEESIPDLFSGGPAPGPAEAQPAAPAPVAHKPAPVHKPTPAPEPAPAQAKPAAPVAKPAGRKSPVAISAANPNELVAKTAQLAGVGGALLAMNDGLVVASQLPKPLQGETVAAFLPQIFGRLNQFATELKLGDLSSVMLVMDNCPWIIFRTGKVYFAVMGRSGEALPLPQLTAIVAEIKRQNL